MALLDAAAETVIPHVWLALTSTVIAYVATVCIYRRFFHPLANIPGPLPAVFMLYQSYYNRRFYLQIDKLHQQYGPIVRIGPNEVHLNNPEDYDKIYHVGSKFCKSPIFYNALCVPHSSFGTISNEVHRVKRGAMSSVFHRQTVLDLEAIIQDKAEKVCARMQTGIENSEPADLHHAFRAMSIDVASEFVFGKCYNFLESPDIGSKFFEMARGIGPALYAFQQFPSLQSLALKVPPWLAPYLSKPLGYVTSMQMECVAQIEAVKERIRKKQDPGRPTLFTVLLSEEDKPEGFRVPETMEIKDEAYSVLAAAADTTGNAMTVAAFNVLSNPAIYKALVEELVAKFPHQKSDLPYLELEKLPYLTAVIKEGLRLSFGVVGRLPRVVSSSGLAVSDHFLPSGTIVSMSSWMMHRDTSVFADPMKFDPDRWLVSLAETRRLERNIVAFGRGSRQCIGMPLAYAELYVALGTLFRRYPEGLKVWNTPVEAMTDYEDFFSSYHPYAKRDEWFKAYMPAKA